MTTLTARLPTPCPDAQRILDTVAGYYNVTPAQIRSVRRHKHIILPRWVVAHLIRKLSLYSLETVGEFLNRDHTTVLNAVRRLDERMSADSQLAAQVQYLEEQLTATA